MAARNFWQDATFLLGLRPTLLRSRPRCLSGGALEAIPGQSLAQFRRGPILCKGDSGRCGTGLASGGLPASWRTPSPHTHHCFLDYWCNSLYGLLHYFDNQSCEAVGSIVLSTSGTMYGPEVHINHISTIFLPLFFHLNERTGARTRILADRARRDACGAWSKTAVKESLKITPQHG